MIVILLANGPLLPAGLVSERGWLTPFACRIVTGATRQSAGRYAATDSSPSTEAYRGCRLT